MALSKLIEKPRLSLKSKNISNSLIEVKAIFKHTLPYNLKPKLKLLVTSKSWRFCKNDKRNKKNNSKKINSIYIVNEDLIHSDFAKLEYS